MRPTLLRFLKPEDQVGKRGARQHRLARLEIGKMMKQPLNHHHHQQEEEEEVYKEKDQKEDGILEPAQEMVEQH